MPECGSQRPQRRGGFTLMEMLMVVTIISILMGLVVVVVGAMREHAKKRQTRMVMDAVVMALRNYKKEFDEYPPSPGTEPDNSPDDGTLWEYLGREGGPGLIRKSPTGNTAQDKYYEPWLPAGLPGIQKRDDGKTILMDGWGQPLRYFNCEVYLRTDSGDKTKCFNQRGYILYSLGSDRTDGTTEHPEAANDNLKSWE